MSVRDYSTTPASNTSISSIDVSESCAAANINDAIRQQMADIADVVAGNVGLDVLNLADDDASASIKIQAPSVVTTTTTLTLPDGDGSNGEVLTTNGSGTLSWSAVSSPNVKEIISLLQDGESTTINGTAYTTTNVTGEQLLTTTYADVNGSDISYTPPSGTVAVIYEYSFMVGYGDAYPIAHFKFFIDTDEVTAARQTIATQSLLQAPVILRHVIPVGGTADTATGRQATWTTAKTLKIQAREYGGSNEARLFRSLHWDGLSNQTEIRKPSLTITAIGS